MMLNPRLQPGHLDVRHSPPAGPLVVMVEDHADLRKFLSALIREALPTARILGFANGDDAWAWLEHSSPDLLISDLFHPGMGGTEILLHLALKGAEYPIVMVSGMMGMMEPLARRVAGPGLNVQYWPKPFLAEDFVGMLKRFLEPVTPQDRLLRWSAALPRPLKIVQLDDEEFIFNLFGLLVQRCLRKVWLYQSRPGPDAWRLLTEGRPDLLITSDRMAPGGKWIGERVVPRLVAQGVDYPILVASGWPPTYDWVRRLQTRYPKCSYLLKPFSPDQFYRQLDRIFGREEGKG